jgi:hypothetical protein
MAERRRSSVPQTIGAVLVGFDEQVWSRRPPAQERVEQVGRLRTVATPGGLTIELPPDGETAAGDGRTGAGDAAGLDRGDPPSG